MNTGTLDGITCSSCGAHWECFWFQCAAASDCKQTSFIVVRGRGGLVQAVLTHTKWR